MMRRPPRSPLFPYTTLFRSALPRTARIVSVLDRTKEPGSCGEPLYLDIVAALHENEDAKDRKSTRLNSSHANISYAVFCLKKKKNKTKIELLNCTHNSYERY